MEIELWFKLVLVVDVIWSFLKSKLLHQYLRAGGKPHPGSAKSKSYGFPIYPS